MLSLVGLIALIISILIVVFITQLLWNYAMVPVFGLTMAGYKSTIIPTAIGYTQNHPDGSTASYTTIGNEINSSIP